MIRLYFGCIQFSLIFSVPLMILLCRTCWIHAFKSEYCSLQYNPNPPKFRLVYRWSNSIRLPSHSSKQELSHCSFHSLTVNIQSKVAQGHLSVWLTSKITAASTCSSSKCRNRLMHKMFLSPQSRRTRAPSDLPIRWQITWLLCSAVQMCLGD